MAIRSIGAKALQQNKTDSVVAIEQDFVAINSNPSATADVGPNELDTTVSGHTKTTIRRSSRRLLVAGCLGLIVAGSTGCTMFSGLGRSLTSQECIDDFMIAYRNKAMAEKAWHCRKDRFCDQRFEKEFKAGFLAGYAAVAESGYACTPAIAPSQYWGWKYQSAGGQGAVNAWFQGFPEGARAAEEDGIGNWRQVGVSGPRAQAGIPAGQPLRSYVAPDAATLTPVHGDMMAPGDVAPVNPFLNGGEMAPAGLAPGVLDLDGPGDLKGATIDVFDSADANDSKGSMRDAMASDGVRFEVGRAPVARTASKGPALAAPATMNDQSDFDVEKIFGSSAGSTSISDKNQLPFSFE